jgi:hypothetical protein
VKLVLVHDAHWLGMMTNIVFRAANAVCDGRERCDHCGDVLVRLQQLFRWP